MGRIVGASRHPRLETEPKKRGVQIKTPCMGRVWIFSGITDSIFVPTLLGMHVKVSLWLTSPFSRRFSKQVMHACATR